jgi:hypothetical protein
MIGFIAGILIGLSVGLYLSYRRFKGLKEQARMQAAIAISMQMHAVSLMRRYTKEVI